MTAEHGTRSRYVRGCRCDDCRSANRDYNRANRDTRVRMGLRSVSGRLIDAGPAVEHVAWLRGAQMGIQRIAAAAGVDKTTIERLAGINGPVPARVTPATERAVLAVVPQARWLDPTGTARRLRALIALGHTRRALAAGVGADFAQMCRWVRADHQVSPATAARVHDLYLRCWEVRPTGPAADRARAEARRSRWASPLAWDSDTIDDPRARPDTGHRRARLVAQPPRGGQQQRQEAS